MYEDEEGFDFDFFSGCDIPYSGSVDTASGASPVLRAHCGIDEARLVDGIELATEGAQSLLEDEAV